MKLQLLLFLSMFWLAAKGQNLSLDSVSQDLSAKRPTFKQKELILPTTLMVAGIIINGNQNTSVKNEVKKFRNRNLTYFKYHLDDYLQFVPYAAVYGLEFAGLKPENDWKNRTAILIKSHAINLGLCYVLKKTVNETRPDNTSMSFPSGHTAEAFAGATMVSMEYGKRYKWVPYAAYGTASLVGIMRVCNNKHYLSDVLFGAGMGILSTKIAYWTHQYKWNKKSVNDSWTDPLDGKVYQR